MLERARAVVYTHRYDSPIGPLHLAVDRAGTVLQISYNPIGAWPPEIAVEENKYACGELEHQLDAYFRGVLRSFTVATRLSGTAFQQGVWKRLTKIEYGSTVTYGEIARKLGRAGAARAVGNAVAVNPVPIVIPCHRVVAADQRIGKYALRTLPEDEGTRVKTRLLEFEGAR